MPDSPPLADLMRGLPGWASELAEQCPGYRFAPCTVFSGRAVAAVRVTPGPGPHVVITSEECEMRQALGLTEGEETR
jgi:hypothetical protein